MDKIIFLAEDEVITALYLKKFLADYKTFHIKNGEELFELSRNINPDLIIADINFNSSIDGVTAIKAIRNSSDVPVIFISAYLDSYSDDLRNLHNVFFVPKPINYQLLKEYINKILLVSPDPSLK